jgi:hypothetical protein
MNLAPPLYRVLSVLVVVGCVAYVAGIHRAALRTIADECESAVFHRIPEGRIESFVDGIQRRACSLHARVVVRSGTIDAFDFELSEADVVVFPYIVDSNSPAFRDANGLRLAVTPTRCATRYRWTCHGRTVPARSG